MILLDTHVLIWLESEFERISSPARFAIEESVLAGEMLAISMITFREIATLARKGHIAVPLPIKGYFATLERHYQIIPLSRDTVCIAAELTSPFPKDPMDRLVAATALTTNRTLITADRLILASKACKLLW